jgi:serpin B
MSASDMPLKIARRGGATMIELAYGRQAYAMTIVLPPPGVALRDYAAGLTRAAWDSMVGGLGSATLPLTMPKFTFQYALRLDGVLRSLGMGIAFCDGGDPNFTNMDETGRACISEVRHKTFVLVDEAGTEAAAVTSVGVGVTSAPLPVTIDRPFLFAIRERLSGTILFIGIVRNPAS